MADSIFTEPEIWKDIVGYEGLYQVSNIGRVKRLETKLPMQRWRKTDTRILKARILRYRFSVGYHTVSLSKKSKVINYHVHRLVATAFIPNPDNKPMVNHIDSSRNNNRVENLEWVTAKENQVHASRSGRFVNAPKGESHHNARLTEEKVLHIMSSNKSTYVLGRELGVDRRLIGNIRCGRGWRHITKLSPKTEGRN